MVTAYVPPEPESILPQHWASPASPGPDAEVKPWVCVALECVGSYLDQLSTDDKTALFRVMSCNPQRIAYWQAEGYFASLPALQAKIRDWRARGLAGQLTSCAAESGPCQCEARSPYDAHRMADYIREIREQVCSRCIEKPPGGPPCAPLGKLCGLELHLEQFVSAVHDVESPFIAPYLDHDRAVICTDCEQRGSSECPCPMDYLAVLGVQAIETVDQRRARAGIPAAIS
jgi:hypothetical protein